MAKSGKVTYEMRKYIAINPHKMSAQALGRKFGVHHTAIIYHQKIMELNGIKVNKLSWKRQSKNVLEDLKKELKKHEY